jgi:hypothetical protein
MNQTDPPHIMAECKKHTFIVAFTLNEMDGKTDCERKKKKSKLAYNPLFCLLIWKRTVDIISRSENVMQEWKEELMHDWSHLNKTKTLLT